MAVTINGTSGISTPATASGGTTAVAWVNFNGLSGASPVIRASYNVSSVVRNSSGNYTITFANALVDANYAFTTSGVRGTAGTGATYGGLSQTAYSSVVTTTTLKVQCIDASPAYVDVEAFTVVVFR